MRTGRLPTARVLGLGGPDTSPSPVGRMTHACENITFAKLLLRVVIRWLYKRGSAVWHFNTLTYRLRRRTTFCWCARCGRGVVWSSGGRHPYHSASPDTCWRRYERLPEPLTTAVPARLTPDVCTVETRLREPSYVPDHRYGSLDLAKKFRKIKM